MVTELKTKERLEGVQRLLDAGNVDLAGHIIQFMIDEIDLQVEEFEEELEGFYGS